MSAAAAPSAWRAPSARARWPSRSLIGDWPSSNASRPRLLRPRERAILDDGFALERTKLGRVDWQRDLAEVLAQGRHLDAAADDVGEAPGSLERLHHVGLDLEHLVA